MLGARALEIEAVTTGEVVQPVEYWMSYSHTPPDRAAQVREMFARDEKEDLSGACPFRRDGELFFIQRTVTLVARKLKLNPNAGAGS
jgi:hypothetical protein